MSSALFTNSERSPLLIDCRYRSTARRISSTILFHVRGTGFESSKNFRDIADAMGVPRGLFAKEVVVVPIGGIVDCTAEKLVPLVSRDRVIGEVAFIESMDVAGDTPSDTKERRRPG